MNGQIYVLVIAKDYRSIGKEKAHCKLIKGFNDHLQTKDYALKQITGKILQLWNL